MIPKPLHEKILVQGFPPETKTEGGLYIPDSAQERPSKATVVSVGEGLKDRPMELKAGDVVFHVKGAGSHIEIEGEKYYFLRDVDVLGFERK